MNKMQIIEKRISNRRYTDREISESILDEIRKMIDYFCHLMQKPSDYDAILANDPSFSNSDVWQKIRWVINEQEDIYVPSYTDVLRVSFTHKFRRGKIADLVSLLSGRNFETRENIESIAADSFALLRKGVEAFVNDRLVLCETAVDTASYHKFNGSFAEDSIVLAASTNVQFRLSTKPFC